MGLADRAPRHQGRAGLRVQFPAGLEDVRGRRHRPRRQGAGRRNARKPCSEPAKTRRIGDAAEAEVDIAHAIAEVSDPRFL